MLIWLKSKECIDSALALSQADELGRKLRDLRRNVLEAADGGEQIQTSEAMLDYLDGTQWQAEVTPDLFENLVERIAVVSADEVRFRRLNGPELAFNLTKRQLICFGSGAVLGIPLFFLLKGPLGSSAAAMCMILVMLPFFMLGIYEKNGQPLKTVVRNILNVCFLRPKQRPYAYEDGMNVF